MTIQEDLEFLKEMKDRLKEGIDNRDPVALGYVQKMIDDWIAEIEGK